MESTDYFFKNHRNGEDIFDAFMYCSRIKSPKATPCLCLILFALFKMQTSRIIRGSGLKYDKL